MLICWKERDILTDNVILRSGATKNLILRRERDTLTDNVILRSGATKNLILRKEGSFADAQDDRMITGGGYR